MRHSTSRVEPEESLVGLALRLVLFLMAVGMVLLAFRSRVPETGRGTLLLPVQGVNAEQLTDSFLDPRETYRRHRAIDIMAPWGTPVIASDDGVIRRMTESDRGGLGIYQVDSQSRRCYYYGHLARYAFGLEEGSIVARGDLLGFVGDTGNASENAPHLHFAAYELKDDGSCFAGTPLNPFTLLVAD